MSVGSRRTPRPSVVEPARQRPRVSRRGGDEPAVVAHALEAARRDVLEQVVQKPRTGEGDGFACAAVFAITEGNALRVAGAGPAFVQRRPKYATRYFNAASSEPTDRTAANRIGWAVCKWRWPDRKSTRLNSSHRT